MLLTRRSAILLALCAQISIAWTGRESRIEEDNVEALLNGDDGLRFSPEKGDEPLVVLATFMMLRAAVALRSLHEDSAAIMWQGIAFAIFTRCLAGSEGVSGMDAGVVIAAGCREMFHVYGLRTALRQLSPGCS
mmetsp:Transcript_46226/g.86263  ORF Transcript_46226/g.86263 Transcript_46226/m.86263 type:complete len:134 (+) Transcript_46226:107-508(+)